ncbi:MAG TPA: 50S ribosomal protein L11 methyltransferase, partial [Epsilonproteobacteria bacterium]|nr:50S ribosomal protein L11 methyltransferase [Campylobacterota bacterium]
MDKEYFELTITTDEKYIDLLSDTICTISDEGIEIGKNQIIIRSENDLIPLQNQLKDILSSIDEIEADFLLSKKENSDWIAAYQSSIEPIESGEFYI